MKNPILTIVIPTYNAGPGFVRFFESLKRQDVGSHQIEILVMDGGSTDKTRAIAKKYGATVIHNPQRLAEPGVALGFQKAKGGLVMVLAADNIYKDPDAIQTIISTFHDKRITAVFPKHDSAADDTIFSRYFNIFTDPFTHFVYGDAANARTFHNVYKTTEHTSLYDVYGYASSPVRPVIALAQGFTVRKSAVPVRAEHFDDIMVVHDLIAGGKRLAYAHGVTLFHYTIASFRQFVFKQRRAVENALVRANSGITRRKDTLTLGQKIRFVLYVPYGLCFAVPVLVGIYKFLTTGEAMWLLHPVVTYISVAVILYEVIRIIVHRPFLEPSHVIAAHCSPMGNGAAPNLKKYVMSKIQGKIVYISHPLLYVKESYSMTSECDVYKGTNFLNKKKAFHWKLPEPLLYIKDILYTLVWVLTTPGHVQVFFGGDNLMACTGIFLKLLGKVKRVVYYGVDYFPIRFENPMMNAVYHFVDKICVRYADETWNVSPQMQIAREMNGMKGPRYARQYTVPMGIWYDEVQRLPVSKIETRLFYIGTISDYMGLDLVIRSMPKLVSEFSQLRLDIVGIGPAKKGLERLVRQRRLGTYVTFYGLVAEGPLREKLFQRAAIGLAPFNTQILDARVKNADPVKLKEYMSYGMPIIVTDAISNADEIRASQCGIVIPFNEHAFIRAVSYLLGSNERLRVYRAHALDYVRRFDWNTIFEPNMRRVVT